MTGSKKEQSARTGSRSSPPARNRAAARGGAIGGKGASDAERLSALWRASNDAILEFDLVSKKIVHNDAAERIFGSVPGATAPLSWLEALLHTDDRERVMSSLRAGVLSDARSWQGEHRLRRADGTYELFLSRIEILRHGARATRLVALVQDVGARSAVRHVERRTLDALTGLADRTLLRTRLDEALESTRLGQIPVAAIVLDIDRFKDVNETLGHPLGDALLQEAGRRLSAIFRASDTVARLGGDEFGVVLPRSNAESAMRIATRVLQSLAQPALIRGHTLNIEASLGVAVAPDQGMDAETLLRRAEIAMYSAKESGGAMSRLYAPEQEQQSPERFALLTEFRQAIDRDELKLHYQPKIALATGVLVGVEALSRWESPGRGIVQPDTFVQIAEQTALNQQFGHWVLRTAISQCRAWKDGGIDIHVAVNLSMRSLEDPGLPDFVAMELRERSVEPNRLTIEATETGLMRDRARVFTNLQRLRQIGVRLSVDDFGTGYSSLTHLREMPLDELKVDRSFVKEMTTKPSDAAIVASVVHLAQLLGRVVVAEGVEDEQTLAALRELGCDYAQGYHIGRPMPADELLGWATSRGALPETKPAPEQRPILIVDDEPALRHLMRLALEARGHSCILAADAAEARRALHQAPLALVLLDVGLPGESGIELARWIRMERPGLPVVLVTGSDDASLPAEAKRLGLAAFVAKPFTPEVLLRLIEHILDTSSSGGEARADHPS